jgi:ATP-dependent Lhr-like helicase
VELVRGQLQALGPVTVAALGARLGVGATDLDAALAALEGEGFAMRGRFTPHHDSLSLRERVHGDGVNFPSSPPVLPEGQGSEPRRAAHAPSNIEWCERRLLARIHRYTIERLRAEIEPVSAANFLRFLFRWHGISAEPKPEGPQALAAIVEQLEGFEAAAGSWEADILPVRTHHYDPEWLDGLCLSGKIVWARLAPPKPAAGKDRMNAPVRATPIAFLARRTQPLWRQLAGNPEARRLSPRAQSVHDLLAAHGASFFDDIVLGTGLLKSQAEEALAELVAAGLVNADSFTGLRALLLPVDKQRKLRRRRAVGFGIEAAGRWTLLHKPSAATTEPTDVEAIARLLLRRYGVVFKRLLERETDLLPSWYELLQVLRRLEARGEIRGGRFVAGPSGEQYALPEAVASLRALRKEPADGRLVSLSAADPLNLVGILTPGARVPALASNRVLYRDGVPIAVQVGGEAQFLETLAAGDEWTARNALLRSPLAPGVRAYLH